MCLVMPNFCGSDQMISHHSAIPLSLNVCSLLGKLKFGRFLIAARADALAGGRADNKMLPITARVLMGLLSRGSVLNLSGRDQE